MGRKAEQPRIALVVEDDTEVRRLAAALLEETEFDVVEAASAEEAIDYLSAHADAVAFLFADIRLPYRMNGLDLARTVSARWPWVRTVLTSGAPLDGGGSGLPGDVRFMQKPWRALDILVEAERASTAASSATRK